MNDRYSKNKIVIKDILKNSKRPLTAKEIYSISKSTINVDFSTIYRILKNLEEENFVTKTIRQNKNSYYEIKTNEHKHQIICSCCNKEIQIDCPIIDNFKNYLEMNTGYEINYHNLELRGLCPNCRKNKK